MNNCYGLSATGRDCATLEGRTVILLLAGIILFASFLGALTYMTAPVALALAVFIAGWLFLFGMRTLLARKETRRG